MARGRSEKPRSGPAPAARGEPQRARTAAARDARAKSAEPVRAWLGPRLALGVAALAILGAGVAGLVLSRREARQDAGHASMAARLFASLGFRVEHILVQGAPDMARPDIARETQLAPGAPILDIRLDDLRKRIEAGGWVKQAKVLRLLPDTVVIAVTPRRPLAVWQHAGAVHVVDTEGQVIGEADPARFADLPLLVGDGAPEQAHAILPLLRERPALMAQIDALIRVDQRRWDLRLKNETIVLLPASGEETALMRLDRLDQQQHVLSLNLDRIDLRTSDALVVRPRIAAPPAAADPAKAKH